MKKKRDSSSEKRQSFSDFSGRLLHTGLQEQEQLQELSVSRIFCCPRFQGSKENITERFGSKNVLFGSNGNKRFPLVSTTLSFQRSVFHLSVWLHLKFFLCLTKLCHFLPLLLSPFRGGGAKWQSFVRKRPASLHLRRNSEVASQLSAPARDNDAVIEAQGQRDLAAGSTLKKTPLF